jgi:hypothetical protein
VAVSRHNTLTAYWYERKSDSDWIRHSMGTGEGLENTLDYCTGKEILKVLPFPAVDSTDICPP